MCIYIQWWPKLLEHLTDLKILTFFASKTWFNFIMFMKHADGCSEHNKYQMKWVVMFLSTLNCNISYVHILQQLQQQHLSDTVSIYFMRTFLWIYNRSVQFILQLAPNLFNRVEVWTLRVAVHHFQCSSRFLPSQVVPAIVCFMGIVMANKKKN